MCQESLAPNTCNVDVSGVKSQEIGTYCDNLGHPGSRVGLLMRLAS